MKAEKKNVSKSQQRYLNLLNQVDSKILDVWKK